ncbi:Y-family DNA polymerase [Lacticaseibacillus parahuelsenbergensis]|uniref:Y-family DNA polymerase n=1 Tax=Lacticaseibacillus parahuelsenbergensis TaxID=3068305 RepID=A0ABY9L5D0_9LACO|nr:MULTISPECIES: Y-family DNA polymerase [Lacticaseibacillus]MDE3282050.1 Y-family DNA polymerase [Lacticaseibacillus casei]WLV78942.1 Y-family DNA polymerase [Lacticaseibacillus sp. NCIMB 15471]
MAYDYPHEPHRVIFLIDNKSFYASVESIERGLDPLKTILVVMSEQENTNGGLILATSPMAKKMYGLKNNVSRQRDLPNEPHLIVVPPRMNLYIQKNLAINDIFRQFVADEDLWAYSIDESILDLTHTWKLFGKTPRAVAKRIQSTVQQKLGLRTTVGIGENPVQAKIALDVYAKHSPDLLGEIKYATVPNTIWKINEMTDVWSIGHRTAAHLARMGITNMYELAHANPYALKQEMGIIGTQLFATAWGVDRTKISKRIVTRQPSIGNSQVLPRDYSNQFEIEIVIKEIGEQVAARLRHHHKRAGELSLGIGFSYAESQQDGRSGFTQAKRILPTNRNTDIVAALREIFRKNWHGEVIRNVAVFTSRLAPDTGEQLNFFEPVDRQIKATDLERTLDTIRSRFGFKALVYAKSAMHGGTAIQRASLVGGHNGGNSYD